MTDTHSPDQIFISTLTEIILANLGNENFGIKELLHLSGMSYFGLSRRMHSITGRTINQFIREIRLKRAFEMLQNEQVTAAEVAYKVGFSSPAYFNKCFHEFFGFPPGTVKKKSSDNKIDANSVQNTEKNENKKVARQTIVLAMSGILFIILLVYIGYNIFLKNMADETGKSIKHHEKSIAVLPFKNLSSTIDNQYFIDGIMEEILTYLSRIHDLRVVSRTSVEQFRDGSSPASEIGKKLDVDYLVEGIGQKYGNKFRLSVQLIRAKGKETNLWAESYEREIRETSDIFNLQIQIAQTIAAELKATITPDENRLIERISTTNLTAYDFYQRGKEEYTKYRVTNNNTALKKAEYLYHKALEYDSTFARSYTGLAQVYFEKHHYEENFSENFLDSVLILADKALSFDKLLSEAYTLRGRYYDEMGKPDQASEEFDKAIKFNPNDWMAYREKGLTFYYPVDLVNMINYIQKAVSINRGPELPSLLNLLGFAYLCAGFPEKAKFYYQEELKLVDDSVEYYSGLSFIEFWLANFKKSIEYGLKAYSIDSTNELNLVILGWAYECLGQDEESLKYYKKWYGRLKTQGHISLGSTHNLGYAYWQNGYKEEAEYYFNEQIRYDNNLNEIQRSWGQNLFTYYDLASVYAFRGEKDKAYKNLRIFNQIQRASFCMAMQIKFDPLFVTIRNEPEFRQIVRDIEAKYQTEHERVRKWLVEQGEL